MSIYANNREGTGEVFWGEITPSEHIVQIYDDSAVFLDALEGYVAGGLRAGDGVIIIGTPATRDAMDARLAQHEARGEFNMRHARSSDQYITLDADETLSLFMRNGWPDESLFKDVITHLLGRSRGEGERRVRAFGEMVALLWAQGHNGATVRLEHMWHRLCQNQAFCLFCAYPRVGFTQRTDESICEICAAHSRVVGQN